jgi:GxxExxY protein
MMVKRRIMQNKTRNNAARNGADGKNRRTKRKTKLLYPSLSYQVRGACFELRKDIGWGHKEKVYQRGLAEKLKALNINFEREQRIPIKVNGKKVGTYIPDFVIENKIMLEIKAKQHVIKQDVKQFWQYLRISPYLLGFLVNFGNKKGVRIMRRIYDKARPRSSASSSASSAI